MNEKGILKSGNTTLEKRDSDESFLGSVYQIFGLYPELYYGMISAELQEEAQKEHLGNSSAEAEAEE